MSLTHEPSKVLKQYMLQEGLFVAPYAGDWPMWNSHLPEEVDDAAVVYDNPPQLDGRLMGDGEVLQHMGVNILLRNVDYSVGWLKLAAVMVVLSQVVNESVVVESTTYLLKSVTNVSGVIALGQEKGTKRRNLFEMNLLLSLDEV
jgi:hypothetical protein